MNFTIAFGLIFCSVVLRMLLIMRFLEKMEKLLAWLLLVFISVPTVKAQTDIAPLRILQNKVFIFLFVKAIKNHKNLFFKGVKG